MEWFFMKYVSKKDWWLTVVWGFMLVSMGSAILALLAGNRSVGEILVVLILGVFLPIFVLWIWLTTYYVLDEHNLIIKYGPFQKTIPLSAIRSVKKTTNPLSSPALSLKRLEIFYGTHDVVLISPPDRDAFIRILAERCPQLRVQR
jgi:hypothetical protein